MNMFLDLILHFNIASLFIFAITIFYVVYRKSYKAYSSLTFLIINILYIVICILDLLVSSNIGLPILPKKIFMFAYFYIKYIASIIFVIYLLLITNSIDILKNKLRIIIFLIPFIITTAYLISNIFTGQIYYFDGDSYIRGNFIFLFYGLCFIYVLFGIVWILRFIKMFRPTEVFAILSVYFLSIVALIIQYFNGDILIEILFSSLSFLLLSITIEKSSMIVDPKTGLKNKNQFVNRVFVSFKRKKEIGLVLIYIKNLSLIYEKYNYDIATTMIKKMIFKLSKVYLDKLYYESYSIDTGVIGLITLDFNDANKLVNLINETLMGTNFSQVGFNMDYLLCVSRLPLDFKNLDDFYNFQSDFIYRVDFDKEIINISELKKEPKYEVLFNLDNIIEKAIDNKDIIIEYQPIYNTKEKKYTTIEAFVRINDDKYGLLEANQFISYAEKKGLIYNLDMLIIENVYSNYKKLLEDTLVNHITINISAHTLLNDEFLKELKKLEDKYSIEKNKVYFEIKERDKSTFIPKAFEIIKKMMSFGYLFSLDNFGIGCMPVGNLAKVPFVGVKFDKSFSKDIKSDETRIIIEDTIKLFNKLDKKSVCTGIENSDDAMAVEKLKPDYLQGYYYSKPLRLEELIQFLKIKNFNI